MWESIRMNHKPMVHLSARKVLVLERVSVHSACGIGCLQCF